jgi:hypothetical protein
MRSATETGRTALEARRETRLIIDMEEAYAAKLSRSIMRALTAIDTKLPLEARKQLVNTGTVDNLLSLKMAIDGLYDDPLSLKMPIESLHEDPTAL